MLKWMDLPPSLPLSLSLCLSLSLSLSLANMQASLTPPARFNKLACVRVCVWVCVGGQASLIPPARSFSLSVTRSLPLIEFHPLAPSLNFTRSLALSH